MASADVKLTMNPTQFNLMVACLEESATLLREEVADHTPGSEGWQENAQRLQEVEALINQLTK